MFTFLTSINAEWATLVVSALGGSGTLFWAFLKWMNAVDKQGKENKTSIDGLQEKVDDLIDKDSERGEAIARIDAGVQILLKKEGLI